MKLPIYQIDAFTSRLFGGNPAAVVILDQWLPDDALQSIAAEHNLAETAFVIPRESTGSDPHQLGDRPVRKRPGRLSALRSSERLVWGEVSVRSG
jgi:hypothetical protein